MLANDTIAAISTPPGRGGLGIVRVSGPTAYAVTQPLLRMWHPPAPGRVRRAQVVDPETGAVLDEAVVTHYAAPHSYTTEDVVEISCHGAPVLLAAVLAGCLAQGARLAEPGEFTQRAFLAGRLDLTEAEAVQGLVSATTLAQARLAAAQLGGSVARAVRPAREQLLNLIAELEAGIDFVEDDLELIAPERLLQELEQAAHRMRALAETYRFGRVLHDGLTLAVAGRPNAGKSSLFNRLLGRDRAIVTAVPGTTRDTLTETLELDGIPVRLVDTAGLRQVPDGPEGEPERLGIARTQEAVAEADVVVLLQELTVTGRLPPDASWQDLRETLLPGHSSWVEDARPVLKVLTKSDLIPAEQLSDHAASTGALLTSAHTGAGIETLRQSIVAAVAGPAAGESTGAMISTLRQHTALQAALGGMTAAQAAAANGLPHELLLLDLYAALEALDQLAGHTPQDEVLRRIFSTFCIGK